MITVIFQSTSNFDEDSAQKVGVDILHLTCHSTDFDWGSLGLVPEGEEDAIYIAQLVQPLTNESGEDVGAGWMILSEDEMLQANGGYDVLSMWPQLCSVLGCTFARMYVS